MEGTLFCIFFESPFDKIYLQVILILGELGVPYTIHSFKFDDVKKPPFIDINPNGRAPGVPINLLRSN